MRDGKKWVKLNEAFFRFSVNDFPDETVVGEPEGLEASLGLVFFLYMMTIYDDCLSLLRTRSSANCGNLSKALEGGH